MAFCRNCGAQIADESAQCVQCGVAGQYYQPVTYGPPPGQSPDDEVGKALGIVALIIVIVIIVTIVLAAVLYVMVIDFGGSVRYSTPVGSWSQMSATSTTTGEITFGTFSPDVYTKDLRIHVQEDGNSVGYLSWTGDTSSNTVSMNWIGGPSGASAEYIDYNIAGGEVNAGDHIRLDGLEPGTTYSFEVFCIPTDSLVSMIGTESFTTEP